MKSKRDRSLLERAGLTGGARERSPVKVKVGSKTEIDKALLKAIASVHRLADAQPETGPGMLNGEKPVSPPCKLRRIS